VRSVGRGVFWVDEMSTRLRAKPRRSVDSLKKTRSKEIHSFGYKPSFHSLQHADRERWQDGFNSGSSTLSHLINLDFFPDHIPPRRPHFLFHDCSFVFPSMLDGLKMNGLGAVTGVVDDAPVVRRAAMTDPCGPEPADPVSAVTPRSRPAARSCRV